MQRLDPWLIDLVRESGTPHFVFDLHIIRQQISALRQNLPHVTLLYSTKTNSALPILDTCLQEAMQFDAASIGEIELLLSRGANPKFILYTHPVKSIQEIKRAYELGIRLFTCDSLNELLKLHTYAPSGNFFIRFTPANATLLFIPAKGGSIYNYQHRLGATISEVRAMLDAAIKHDINVIGLSFHIGSQSMDTSPWRKALQQSRTVLKNYYERLPQLRHINIGSGFPVNYGFGRPPSLDVIAKSIRHEMSLFPSDVKFLAEPGRIVVAPAAALLTSVIDKVQRSKQTWLFTDATVYCGLIEVLESGGQLQFPIRALQGAKPYTTYNIAGKTLDPDDIIAREVSLPADLKAGGLLLIGDCGAYSQEFFTSYHSLPRPLVTYYDSEHADKVEVTASQVAERGVRTKRQIQKDETVFTVTGHKAKRRSRTSFQINDNLHLEPTLFGAYLNHSCRPNAGIRTNAAGLLNVVAREPIPPGQEVTVDYAMFEYELAAMNSVPCQCNTPDCRRIILGHRHLPPDKKAEYRPHIAHHLTDHASKSAIPAAG